GENPRWMRSSSGWALRARAAESSGESRGWIRGVINSLDNLRRSGERSEESLLLGSKGTHTDSAALGTPGGRARTLGTPQTGCSQLPAADYRSLATDSWPDASRPCCCRHAINRQDVSSHAEIYIVFLRGRVHVVERANHNFLELTVHVVLIPEQLLQVLHPLEIRDGYAAGVGQNVGNNEHAFI